MPKTQSREHTPTALDHTLQARLLTALRAHRWQALAGLVAFGLLLSGGILLLLGKVTKVHPVQIGVSTFAGPPRGVKDFCTLT
jgi:hypothetical protein